MAYQWTEVEKTSNKVTEWSGTPTDKKYPSEKLVKNTIDTLEESIADGTAVVAEATHAANADNLTSTINGKPISDIFEDDGTTVKNATNAVNAIVNHDGTYSGFTKDESGFLKTGNEVVLKEVQQDVEETIFPQTSRGINLQDLPYGYNLTNNFVSIEYFWHVGDGTGTRWAINKTPYFKCDTGDRSSLAIITDPSDSRKTFEALAYGRTVGIENKTTVNDLYLNIVRICVLK